MPWLKKASEAPKSDKLWELSDPAYRLYDGSLHFCAENLTDGHVPASRVMTLKPKPATPSQISELVQGRLWHRLPDLKCKSCLRLRAEHEAAELPRSGYVVHDFLEFNPSKVEWARRTETRREAGRSGGVAKGQYGAARRDGFFQELVDEVGGVCPRCNREAPLVRDHVVPMHMGGEDAVENIQPLCRSCNSAKGKETINWLQRWRDAKQVAKQDAKHLASGELSTELSGKPSETPSGTPSPYPVPRTPSSGSIDPVVPEPEGTDRKSDLGRGRRGGLRPVGAIAAEFVASARAGR